MKTEEDEAFDELAQRQGAWGGGFQAKRKMAADKLHWSDCAVHNMPAYPNGPCDCGVEQEPVAEHPNLKGESMTKDEALTLEALKYAASKGYGRIVREMKIAPFIIKSDKAFAQPAQEPDALTIAYQSGYYDGKKAALAGREWNFCERCGKRTPDMTTIHTCTPPQGDA